MTELQQEQQDQVEEVETMPSADSVFYTPKDLKRLKDVLERRIREVESRLNLRRLIYEVAPELERLLQLGDSYEGMAETYSIEMGLLIKPGTLKRYLCDWRTEQREDVQQEQQELERQLRQQQAQAQANSAATAKRTAPAAQQQIPLPTDAPTVSAVQSAVRQVAGSDAPSQAAAARTRTAGSTAVAAAPE